MTAEKHEASPLSWPSDWPRTRPQDQKPMGSWKRTANEYREELAKELDRSKVVNKLTPLRWHEQLGHNVVSGEQVGSVCHVAQIEARDHRAVFHLTRRMLDELFRHYMNLDLKP